MSKKTMIAQENASKLASIGVAAMEFEAARRRAYLALQAIRKARRDDEGDDLDKSLQRGDYICAARDRKNARERMLRMISRYRDWLDGVNSPKRA